MASDDSDDVLTQTTCEHGSVSNPSMASDDSDDVLTQTTDRARARQGVEHAYDSDDSDDVLKQTTPRARARQGVEPVNGKRR